MSIFTTPKYVTNLIKFKIKNIVLQVENSI